MLFRILLWSFILIMLFRFIVKFVLPILGIARTAKDRLNHMQKQMEDMQNAQNPPAQKNKVKDGDYIEYEEIK